MAESEYREGITTENLDLEKDEGAEEFVVVENCRITRLQDGLAMEIILEENGIIKLSRGGSYFQIAIKNIWYDEKSFVEEIGSNETSLSLF